MACSFIRVVFLEDHIQHPVQIVFYLPVHLGCLMKVSCSRLFAGDKVALGVLFFTTFLIIAARFHFNQGTEAFPILLVADPICICNYRSDSCFHPPMSHLAVFITVLSWGATESFPDIIQEHFLVFLYC